MEALLERPSDELVEALTRIEAGRCAVHQSELDLIWAVDNKGLFRADGATSMAGWLSLRYGWSSRHAGEAVRVARAWPYLPLIRTPTGRAGSAGKRWWLWSASPTPATKPSCWSTRSPCR